MFTKQLSILLLASVAFNANAGWFSNLASKAANAVSAISGRTTQVARSLPIRASEVAQQTVNTIRPVVNEAALTASNATKRGVANTQVFVSTHKEELRGVTAATGLALIVGATAKSLKPSVKPEGLVDALPSKIESTEETPALTEDKTSEEVKLESNEWDKAAMQSELSSTVPAPYKSTKTEVALQKLNEIKDGAVYHASAAWETTSSYVSDLFSRIWNKCPQILNRDRIARNWQVITDKAYDAKEYVKSTRAYQTLGSAYDKAAQGLKAFNDKKAGQPKREACTEYHSDEHYNIYVGPQEQN